MNNHNYLLKMNFANLEKDEIYSLKLTTTEEVIAKVVHIQNDYLELHMPMSIVPSGGGIGLAPTMFTADENKSLTLNTNSISLFGATTEAIKNKYIEATTGIKLPEKKLILG